MGTLYLVRHGQASFGADDYDQLSPLGQRQSLRLGEYLRWRHGDALRLDAVLTGTLRRQRQTWDGIAAGAGLAATPHTAWPGLNEYDSHALIAAVHPAPLPKPDTPELYRQHFRLLRQGMTAWMAGQIEPAGMPSYADFRAGVVGALDHVRSLAGGDGQVMIVSSGGPIATAVGHVLGTTPETTIELNLRIRNSAVTELHVSPKHLNLVTYNTLPHLDAPEYRDWVTYA